MEGLTEGRMVHFVMENGEHRPAIVVKVWNQDQGTSNLTVFPDWTNDGKAEGMFWSTSIVFSEEPKPRTWHWIERA